MKTENKTQYKRPFNLEQKNEDYIDTIATYFSQTGL